MGNLRPYEHQKRDHQSGNNNQLDDDLITRGRKPGSNRLEGACRASRSQETRITMGARRREYTRQGDLLDQSGASLRNALETLRRLDADLPFGDELRDRDLTYLAVGGSRREAPWPSLLIPAG
jgi:hypothetical protein